MARAVLGPLLNDLRGKVGNVVFDNYMGVHIVRSMPTVITNPQSQHQTAVRAAMAVFVQAWRNLTIDQKQLWSVLAVDFIRGQQSDARMNRGGLISLPRGPFSGYNTFIATNMNRFTSGYSTVDDILEDAPITRAKPEPLETFSVTKAGRELTAAWTYINPGPLEERLTIWIRSVDAGVHSQLIYSEARNADGNTVIDQVRRTSGIDVTLPNGVYQLQAQIVNQYGLISPPSELLFIQLGGADMFTYLAVRQLVLNLPAQGASIGDTDLDLSAFVPDGAHTVILEVGLRLAALGAPGQSYFDVYNTVAQGIQIRVSNETSGQIDEHNDNGLCPCSSARHIRYAFTQGGAPANSNITVYLLGYIE